MPHLQEIYYRKRYHHNMIAIFNVAIKINWVEINLNALEKLIRNTLALMYKINFYIESKYFISYYYISSYDRAMKKNINIFVT